MFIYFILNHTNPYPFNLEVRKLYRFSNPPYEIKNIDTQELYIQAPVSLGLFIPAYSRLHACSTTATTSFATVTARTTSAPLTVVTPTPATTTTRTEAAAVTTPTCAVATMTSCHIRTIRY